MPQAAKGHTPYKQRAIRILLAEDHRINQKVAASILNSVGFQVDIASNGIEVLSALAETHFDVIFMDIQMPKMDGLEAIRLIRQDIPEDEQPYIIALTAHALPTDRRRYLDAGADDYLSKPVDLKAMMNSLQRYYAQCDVSHHPVFRDDPPEDSQSTTLTLDWSVLDRLKSEMGHDNQDMVDEIIELFLEDTFSQLGDLRKAADQSDTDRIRSIGT